jgi:hypothetical protein
MAQWNLAGQGIKRGTIEEMRLSKIDIPEYGSHIAPMCRVFTEMKKYNGKCLELGCGFFSTPLLHELCADRVLVTIDQDEGWLKQFYHFSSLRHMLSLTTSWDDLPEYNMEWDIVLVDQFPLESRKVSVSKLADKAKIIMVHDTEDFWGDVYGYRDCLTNFKYLIEYDGHPIRTTIISNFIDVTKWIDN